MRATHHAEAEQLPLQVGQVPALQTGQVVLQPGVGVRVAVGKLVDIVLSVKAESKRHDVVAPVVWAAVVVHIFSRKPLPEREENRGSFQKKCSDLKELYRLCSCERRL